MLIAIAALAGCSSTGTTSSSPSPTPSPTTSSAAPPAGTASPSADLCTTWDDLTTAVTDLQKINVVSGGVSAVQNALQNVQDKFDTFASTARSQFSPQVNQMRDALRTLRSAVNEASASPGATTIASVVSAAGEVGTAFNALHDAVKSRCG